MSTKTIKMTIAAPTVRNSIAVAMQARHGGGCKIMKHRCAPKGGTRNKQAAYRNGDY